MAGYIMDSLAKFLREMPITDKAVVESQKDLINYVIRLEKQQRPLIEYVNKWRQWEADNWDVANMATKVEVELRERLAMYESLGKGTR